MDNHIVPECYIDTMLIQILVPPQNKLRYNHQHGCFDVSNEMESKGLKDKFAVGIIDNDKKKAKYLSGFDEITKVDGSLTLLKHTNKHQYCIEITPAVEIWILKVCEEIGIDLREYGLPNELRELKRITKGLTTIKDERFIKLFKRMKESENEKVRKLIHWVSLLKKDNYQVDINELKYG